MRWSRYLVVAHLFALSLPVARARAASGVDPAATPDAPAEPKTPAPVEPKSPAVSPRKPGQKPARVETGLSAEASLARASAFYEAGQYAQCADAYASLLDDVTQSSSIAPRLREQASAYRAACLIALGRVEDADEVFREAIRENPQMGVPNSIVFPPSVIERFIVVRTTLMEEIRRSDEERAYRAREAVLAARRKAEEEKVRIQRHEKLASQETVVAHNQRWVAWVPFGVGQFQNRDYLLGAVFLASEGLLAGTAISGATIELSLNAQAKGGAGLQGDVAQLNQNIRTANTVALVATGSLLLVAGLGVLQSNLAFVPEYPLGVRPRRPPKLPASPAVSVGMAPTPGGAALSVFGQF